MKKMTAAFGGVMLIMVAGIGGRALGEVKPAGAGGGFKIEQEVALPATPNEVFDAVTGDISAWWDHSFSGHPKKIYIEAKPGGGFYEIFDDAGNGALHARVIYAQRGKMLRFVGPLGLSGRAVDCVTTYELSADPAGTRFQLTVAISGEVDEATAKIVDQAWHHFLFERLKPYIESGEYKKKSAGAAPIAPQGGPGMNAARGKLTDFAWLAGRWTGTAGTDTTEEICMEPSHHAMTCVVRVMDAENTLVLEFITLREIPMTTGGAAAQKGGDDADNAGGASAVTTVEERVRFFSSDLAESQGDNGITLRLASVSATEIVLNNAKESGVVKQVKLIRNGNDEFTSHIDLVGPDGKPGAIEAKWKRGK